MLLLLSSNQLLPSTVNFRCSDDLCSVLDLTGSRSCVVMDGSAERMSKLSLNHACAAISTPAAIKCAKRGGDPTSIPACLIDNRCEYLSSVRNQLRIGREVATDKCLPFIKLTAIGGPNVADCAPNYCMYTTVTSEVNSYNSDLTKVTVTTRCIQLGTYIGTQLFVGIDVNLQCVEINSPSNTRKVIYHWL